MKKSVQKQPDPVARERQAIRAMLKRKKKPAKARKDVGCPNSHLREHLCLTPKEVQTLMVALRSTAQVSGEKDERYIMKLKAKIEGQI